MLKSGVKIISTKPNTILIEIMIPTNEPMEAAMMILHTRIIMLKWLSESILALSFVSFEPSGVF
jgi:hypothetical protein